MILNKMYHGVLAAVCLLGSVTAQQGPKVVTTVGGNEVYDLGNRQLTVVDYDLPRFSQYRMRPTLVYNCAMIPSICKNAAQWLGYLPTNVGQVVMHFDPDSGRRAARNSAACPTGWASGQRADGTPQCPENDQPKWSGYDSAGIKYGPFVAKIHPQGASSNRLTNRWQVITYNSQEKRFERTAHYDDYGAIMTCDEFPAATWIEGGAAGNNLRGATQYCAPFRRSCGANAAVPYQRPLTTDQNFQGDAHNYMRKMLERIHGAIDNTGTGFNSKIYTFNFRTVNDANTNIGAWVEANGVKRYCASPPTTHATNGCDSTLRNGIDIP